MELSPIVIYLKLLIVSLVILVSSCSSHPEIPETPGLFTAQISDNGSKFFSYRLDRKIAGQARPAGKVGGRGGSKGYRESVSRSSSVSDDLLDRGLASFIAQNAYCRTGYVILERSASSLRGECNETATDADRERFTMRAPTSHAPSALGR